MTEEPAPARLIHDEAELLAAFVAGDIGDIENRLYAAEEFDGDLSLRPDGVELYTGRGATWLDYPFTVAELHQLARDVQVECEAAVEADSDL